MHRQESYDVFPVTWLFSIHLSIHMPANDSTEHPINNIVLAEKVRKSNMTDLNRNHCVANNCETISREVTLYITTTKISYGQNINEPITEQM